MTNSEFIDRVEAHLLQQKTQCVDEDGTCVYSDGKGNYCAVGAVLPAGVSSNILDNWATLVAYVARKWANPTEQQAVSTLVGVDYNLIISAQKLHDYTEPRDDAFKAQVRDWAVDSRGKYT